MKNKKGVTIGRILLYILFISLLVFFIYIIACTFKAIKEKNPTSTDTHDVIKKVYNSSYDYSGADYINNAYINFYYDYDFVYHYNTGSFTKNLYNYYIYSNAMPTPALSSDYYVATIQNKVWPYNPTPYLLDSSYFVNDERVSVASITNVLYNFAINGFPMGNNNQYTWSYFYPSSTSTYQNNSYKSAALIFDCDIPLTLWYGNVTGTFNACEAYLLGDDDVLYRYVFNTGFTFEGLPSQMRASCSSIKRVILPIWQSYSSSGLSYYFFGSSYNYNYNSCVNNSSFGINIDFTIFTRDNTYQEGYEDGYNQGVANSDAALRESNDELINRVIALNGQIEDLNSRIESQQIEITTLNNQLQASSNNFKGLFFTMADIPFKTVSNALGFEFWGVNLFRFFVGIITALGVVWLIKRIL